MRLRVLRSVAWVVLLLTGCSSAPPSPIFGGRPVQENEEWPQELTGPDGSKLVLYQPQVERWTDSKVLRGRMALAFQRAGTTTPVLGAVVLEADTETSLETRQVRLSKLRVVEGGFPALGPTGSDRIVGALARSASG